MKNMQKYRMLGVLIGFMLLLAGCGDNGTSSETYSVSDLEGTWLGALTFTSADGSSRTETNVGFSFDVQGNATNWMIPNVVSITGSLSVSPSGAMTGTLIGINTVDVNNNIQDTTTMTVQGNFTSKTNMEMTINATYTRSDGTGGTYTATGTLIRQ